jgi:hypothetical protein
MWDLIAGALKFIGPLINGGQWAYEKVQGGDPVKVIERRAKLRAGFFQHMAAHDNEYGIHGEAIIRNLRRFDSYPDQQPKKGKFPWFYVEMKGLYHRGIEVFIGTRKQINKDMYGTYKFTESNDSDTETGYLVGRICFDDMAHIDWSGDENTPVPHIFCRYNRFKQHPYETIRVFKKIGNSEGLEEVKNFRVRDLKAIF